MTKLPVGYLEMDRADYGALEVDVLRAIFAELRDIARYTMGKDAADHAIKMAGPVRPADWVMAVKRLECKCERCNGSGTYYWGACVNGKMSNSAPCARCGGDGRMTFADMRRGRAYDNHAIARAFS
jgi:hypothetical protein